MSIISDKIRRTRSHVSEFESQTIAEELEEYDYQQHNIIDDNMHCFKVPARLRADSDGLLMGNASSSGDGQTRGAGNVVGPSVAALLSGGP